VTCVGVVGCGAVGRRVIRNLVERDEVDEVLVVSSGRWAEGMAGVETVDERTVRDRADVVVIATGVPQHPLARLLLSAGLAVVTTSDDCYDVEGLLGLERLASASGRAYVVGAAAAPGLSGLLARSAAAALACVDEIHVAIHGTGGPACARQHHFALGSAGRSWYEGDWQDRPGGTGRELCWFPDPVGAHDCYRAALPDPLLLHRVFPTASRITARLTATRRDRLTARLPMLRPPHPEAREGAVRVEVRGVDSTGPRETVVLAAAEPLAVLAGAVAATMAVAAATTALPAGLVVAGDERLPTADLLATIHRSDVAVHRFYGTGSRTSW
jgi:hypothetical protein